MDTPAPPRPDPASTAVGTLRDAQILDHGAGTGGARWARSLAPWTLALLMPPLFILGGGLVWTWGLVALFLLVDWLTARLSAVEARWDTETLTFTTQQRIRSFRWSEIERVEATRRHLVVHAADGRFEVQAPTNEARRNRLIAHLNGLAHRALPDRPPTQLPWRTDDDGRQLAMHLRHRRRPAPPQVPWLPILLGLAGLRTWALWTERLPASPLDPTAPWSEVARTVASDVAPMALGGLALLTLLGVFAGWTLWRRRLGSLRVEQHHLLLQPVDGPPTRLLWEDIQGFGGDDATLRIDTLDGRLSFDVSEGGAEQLDALRADLERTRARREASRATDPESPQRLLAAVAAREGRRVPD